jgi:hypothetical protein
LSQFGKLLSVGVSALARHTILLSGNEEPLTLGVISVEHHPVKDADEELSRLEKGPPASVRGASIESNGVLVLNVFHSSLLSKRELRSN